MDYMKEAEINASISDCLSRQVGACIVDINDNWCASYNQVSDKLPGCKKEGQCLRRKMGVLSGERLELCRIVHAEIAVIINAIEYKIQTKGATLYVTCPPCNICAHVIVSVGIKKVIYKGDYPGNGLNVLRRGGVEVERYQARPDHQRKSRRRGD